MHKPNHMTTCVPVHFKSPSAYLFIHTRNGSSLFPYNHVYSHIWIKNQSKGYIMTWRGHMCSSWPQAVSHFYRNHLADHSVLQISWLPHSVGLWFPITVKKWDTNKVSRLSFHNTVYWQSARVITNKRVHHNRVGVQRLCLEKMHKKNIEHHQCHLLLYKRAI
jgi:hypothetical protein